MTIPNNNEKFESLRKRYIDAHPASFSAAQSAAQWMPGGNTRSVLHYDPFPIVIASGDGSHVVDADGHRYLDCVGEFSAGLYGHQQPAIHQAINEAMRAGLTLGGPNRWEVELAQAVCTRFESIERIRFCNSGTEANLFALATARAITARDTFLVFDGAYHGGVLTFSGGGSPTNVPFDWKVLPYNDTDAAREFLQNEGHRVAAVLVEPILGAGGNIPGDKEFLAALRDETARCGAVLIFDEVKTSRCGPAGVQGLLGLTPDMTTFGKYLGGGLPLGGFGGKAEIMEHYDPRRSDALKHAGTFNNNVISMAAGTVGLTHIYTADKAAEFHRRTERYKKELEEKMQAAGLRICLTGHGSMFSINLGLQAPRNAAQVSSDSVALRRLMHLRCMELGVRLAGRGDVYLSIAMVDADLEKLTDVLISSAIEALD